MGGRRFHLGTNKEVFDAEVFAIYQALLWIEGQQRGAGGRFTIFADSTAAIERVKTDAPALRDDGHRGLRPHPRPWGPGHHSLGPLPCRGREKRDGRQIRQGGGGSIGTVQGRGNPTGANRRGLTFVHDPHRHGGQIPGHGGVDHRQCPRRAVAQTPPGGRPASQTAGRHTEGVGWPFLPIPVRTCEHRVLPSQDRDR